jgi:hypothetical protein
VRHLVTAKRLRAVRSLPDKRRGELERVAGLVRRQAATSREMWTPAPGHFDGDGCVFPAEGHLVLAPPKEERIFQYETLPPDGNEAR